jgi:hypothetical protein
MVEETLQGGSRVLSSMRWMQMEEPP